MDNEYDPYDHKNIGYKRALQEFDYDDMPDLPETNSTSLDSIVTREVHKMEKNKLFGTVQEMQRKKPFLGEIPKPLETEPYQNYYNRVINANQEAYHRYKTTGHPYQRDFFPPTATDLGNVNYNGNWTKPVENNGSAISNVFSDPQSPIAQQAGMGLPPVQFNMFYPPRTRSGYHPSMKQETDFNDKIAYEKKEEGGFNNHKHDPGGLTKDGISTKLYNDWRKRPDVRAEGWPASVTQLSPEQQNDIYRNEFYYGKRLHEIEHPAMRHLLFNSFIMSNPEVAPQISDAAIKSMYPSMDMGANNVIGSKHIAALNRIAREGRTREWVNAYLTGRSHYLNNNKNIGEDNRKTNIKGWNSRLDSLENNITKKYFPD
ncbi:MAG: glycosyl hydrolase 108 family protein [Alphaproteobacteria bacterium]